MRQFLLLFCIIGITTAGYIARYQCSSTQNQYDVNLVTIQTNVCLFGTVFNYKNNKLYYEHYATPECGGPMWDEVIPLNQCSRVPSNGESLIYWNQMDSFPNGMIPNSNSSVYLYYNNPTCTGNPSISQIKLNVGCVSSTACNSGSRIVCGDELVLILGQVKGETEMVSRTAVVGSWSSYVVSYWRDTVDRGTGTNTNSYETTQWRLTQSVGRSIIDGSQTKTTSFSFPVGTYGTETVTKVNNLEIKELLFFRSSAAERNRDYMVSLGMFTQISFYPTKRHRAMQEETLEELAAKIETAVHQSIRALEDKYPALSSVWWDLKSSLSRNGLSCLTSKPRVIILGAPDGGKTTIINALIGRNVLNTQRYCDKGTTVNTWVDLPQLEFLDTIGSSYQNETELEQLHNECKARRPDVLLVITSNQDLPNKTTLPLIQKMIDSIQKCVQQKWAFSIPKVFVFNKIDLFNDWKWDPEEIPWNQHEVFLNQNAAAIRREVIESLKKGLKFDRNNVLLAITKAKSPNFRTTYGIDHLRDLLNGTIPGLIDQVEDNKLKTIAAVRRIIGNKIIAAFSVASSAVGLLPAVDIVILPILGNMMVEILSALSTDPSRTVERYYVVNKVIYNVTSVVRAGFIVASFLFEFTGIGIPIGMGIGATTGGVSSGILGHHALNYFMNMN